MAVSSPQCVSTQGPTCVISPLPHSQSQVGPWVHIWWRWGVSPGNVRGEGPAAQGFKATTTTIPPAPPASQAACSALEFIHVESQSKPLSALTRQMLREVGV